ncbi:MAG TPA: hypothetical protein VFH56_04230 [Acidimicrobiales bacterium]|nr:hypothetical protein [Acidimicrobiales bacterium]
MQFLSTHIPATVHQLARSDSAPFSWAQFATNSVPAGIFSATLSEAVARVPDGRSEIRLDALVVWIPQRPSSEIVPTNVKVVTITRTPGSATTPAGLTSATVTLTDPQQIANLVQIFNSLSATPTVQCVPPPETSYRIAFAESTASKPILVASSGACYDLAVTVWTYPTSGPPRWTAEPDLRPNTTLTGLLDSLTLRLPSGNTPAVTSFYIDGARGTPHYVLSVTSTSTGLSGWMFFVYQDGHVSDIFHYHSTGTTPGVLDAVTMITDTSDQVFPYGNPPPGPQAGSQPVPPGRTFNGTYGSTFALSDCGAYLYWANPANSSKPMSCTFTYSGTNSW